MNDRRGHPRPIRERTDVSDKARLLYFILATYVEEDGVCRPTRSTLADNLGVTRRWVVQLTRELEQADLVRVERVQGKGSRYVLDETGGVNSRLHRGGELQSSGVNSRLHGGGELQSSGVGHLPPPDVPPLPPLWFPPTPPFFNPPIPPFLSPPISDGWMRSSFQVPNPRARGERTPHPSEQENPKTNEKTDALGDAIEDLGKYLREQAPVLRERGYTRGAPDRWENNTAEAARALLERPELDGMSDYNTRTWFIRWAIDELMDDWFSNDKGRFRATCRQSFTRGIGRYVAGIRKRNPTAGAGDPVYKIYDCFTDWEKH